ncbi:unnamed protein product [Diamesa serratosioi]
MDIRLQHHLAQEFYRQQMFQRISDPYSSMMPMTSRQMPQMPARYALPGVEAKLQNTELWTDFHKIGTEMIITKCGRRMFPSMRMALSGLDDDQNYCVLLEMIPTADCRFKFSGSQWVPAGGAEPQSPQNVYIHPDSPALGSHWQAQPINFNKVKLTNNTLDSNGHIVLTSMHKYQIRIHIVRTSEPAQIPWSPQQSYTFNETEFVAVTAYQNDRITKLKIDNNPFAKGFRETGQSRCKRKINSPSVNIQKLSKTNDYEGHNAKRIGFSPSVCSNGSLDESNISVCETSSSGTSSPAITTTDERLMPQNFHPYHNPFAMQHHANANANLLQMHHYQQMLGVNSQWMDLVLPYMNRQQHQLELHSPIIPQSMNSPSNNEQDEAPKSPEKPQPTAKKSNFSISAILGY